MASNAAELVRLRNNFYRDNYRSAIGVLLFSILINAGLVTAVFYLWTHVPDPVYFATTPTGQIWRMVPLDEPIHKDTDILTWATRAATASMAYDFLQYRTQLQAVSPYFTDKAFSDYLSSLKRSGNIDLLTSKRLVALPYLEGTPIIVQKGTIGRRYAWRVQLPIAVRYESSSERLVVKYDVVVLVRRVSTLETPEGIKIDSFVINTKSRGPSRRVG